MVQFLLNWQALIGSIIGASIPIIGALLAWWYTRYRVYRENLYFLQRTIVYTINNLLETRRTILKFTDNHLKELLKNIEECNLEERYSLNRAFFPLFNVHAIDVNLLKISTKSGYLDNVLAKVVEMSKDFPLIVADAANQFRQTLELSERIAFGKQNSVKVHNQEFKKQIVEYDKFIKRELIENNISIYLKSLVTALVCIVELYEIGYFRWKFRFSSYFKFFKNRKDYLNFVEGSFDRVDNHFKDKIEKKLAEIEENDTNGTRPS